MPVYSGMPDMGSASWRVHSNYMRKLRDLPSHGRTVMIHVSARRFRCLNAACARKTFAERLEDALVYGRRTKRLGDLQRYLGLALGGEAGTRLAERVAVPISADTLLRMAASTVPARSRQRHRGYWPSMIGRGVAAIATEPFWSIWSAMKLWTCCPIGKPKRWPPGFASTPVSRLSRATAPAPTPMVSAKGRRPRFKSLTVGTCCAISVMPFGPSSIVSMSRFDGLPSRSRKRRSCRWPTVPNLLDGAKPTAAEQRSQTAYARRQARYEEAARLKTAGASLKRIAAFVGAERKTVRRWLRAGGAPLWRKPRRHGGLAPYHDHLDRRWTEGCHNAAQLWRELVTLGFARQAWNRAAVGRATA